MQTVFFAKPQKKPLCIRCDKDFSNFSNLKRHLRRYRDHDEEGILDQESEDEQPDLKRRRESVIDTTVAESSPSLSNQQITLVQELSEEVERPESLTKKDKQEKIITMLLEKINAQEIQIEQLKKELENERKKN